MKRTIEDVSFRSLQRRGNVCTEVLEAGKKQSRRWWLVGWLVGSVGGGLVAAEPRHKRRMVSMAVG